MNFENITGPKFSNFQGGPIPTPPLGQTPYYIFYFLFQINFFYFNSSDKITFF